MTWRTTLIGLTVTPTHTTAVVRRSDGTKGHDLRPMGGRRRRGAQPRAPCPRHRLHWRYLQPDPHSPAVAHERIRRDGPRPANGRPSVASSSSMSAPASSTSAAASGITCCCSRDQHPTRTAPADATSSRASSLSTRSTSQSTTWRPWNKRCTRVTAHMLPKWGLIRPDGHLAYSGAPENVAGRRT